MLAVNFVVWVGEQRSVVVVLVVIVRVLALVVDFREVMMTSPPELAHSAPLPPTSLGRPDTSS